MKRIFRKGCRPNYILVGACKKCSPRDKFFEADFKKEETIIHFKKEELSFHVFSMHSGLFFFEMDNSFRCDFFPSPTATSFFSKRQKRQNCMNFWVQCNGELFLKNCKPKYSVWRVWKKFRCATSCPERVLYELMNSFEVSPILRYKYVLDPESFSWIFKRQIKICIQKMLAPES